LAQLGKTRSHKDSRSYGILEAVIACARRAQHDRDRAWFDHGATLATRLHSEHLKLAARFWLANAAEAIGGDLAEQASGYFLTQGVPPEALRGEAVSALADASFAEREAVLACFEASGEAQAVLSGIRVRARWGQDVAPLLRTLEARMEPSKHRSVLEYANGTRSVDDIQTHQDADAARDARELLCELGELPRALALASGWGDVVPIARHGRTDDDARTIFRRLGELVPLAWAYSEAMFIIEPLAEHGASIEALDLGYNQALRVRPSERALSLSALAAAFAARGDETRALRCIDRALERPAEVLWTDDERRSERVMALAAAGLIDRAWTEWLQILDAPMQRSTPAMAALECILARVGRERADEVVAQIIERLLAADHKLLKGESRIRGVPTNAGLMARGLGHASPELATQLEDRLIDHWVAKRDEPALGRFLEERVPVLARDRRDALLARAFPEHFLNREQYLVACHAAVRIDTAWPLEQIVDHLQNSSDDARIAAVDTLARAGRERDALALGETCAHVGSQARALLGVARYGAAPELRPEIEKRAKKLPKGKLTVPLQASLHENRAALALHFGGVEAPAFDLALKSVLASQKDMHGRRGPNLPGMVRLSELVERHPGAFRDEQLISLTRGFVGLQPEQYFLQALPAIFHGVRESARPELERAVAEHTEKRPKGYRTEAALGLALGLARIAEMKERATEAMSQALEFAREDARWTVAPWLEAIARNLPKEEASDLMQRLASIAASTDGGSLGAIYEQLLARGRGRAMIDFMRTARMPRTVQQKVVWDCVQTALHAAPDPVDEILAWFDILPEDPSLTNARVEWLWLALLHAGRVEEAEQIATLSPAG
ncbi:MAG TPA: hypothetical protein VJV78_01045, partial [Polyangiales bacterium]|nr:hypothetical protein [Polyangiales bacterium]